METGVKCDKTWQKHGQKTDRSSMCKNDNRDTGTPLPSRQTIVQPKLELTTPGDSYEREADRMADFVMRRQYTGIPTEMPSAAYVVHPTISRSVSGSAGVAVDTATEGGINASRGGGQPMPEVLRSQMESGFGADFSGVRLHTDSRAADLSQGIQAKAFTYGNDIYFNRGQYSPDTSTGQHLIAHELTHVVQQSGKVGRDSVYPECSISMEDVRRGFRSKQAHECLNTYDNCIAAFNAVSLCLENIEKKLNDIFEEIDIEESDEVPVWSAVCSILSLIAAATTFGTSTAIAGTVALAATVSSIGKESYQQTINNENNKSKTAKGRIKHDYKAFLDGIKTKLYTKDDICNIKIIEQISAYLDKIRKDMFENSEKYKNKILNSIRDYKKYVTPINTMETLLWKSIRENYLAEINEKLYLITTTQIYSEMGDIIHISNSIQLIPDNMLDFAKEKAGDNIRRNLAFARSITKQQPIIQNLQEQLTSLQYIGTDSFNNGHYDLVEKRSLLSNSQFESIITSLRNVARAYLDWQEEKTTQLRMWSPGFYPPPPNVIYKNLSSNFWDIKNKLKLNKEQYRRLERAIRVYGFHEMNDLFISSDFESSCKQLLSETF